MSYFTIQLVTGWIIRFGHQVNDHTLQAHSTAIVRRIDLINTVCFQFPDLFRQDYTTTTGKYFDMSCTFFIQQVVHVFQVFHVTTLVRSHRNRIGIFLYRAIYYLLHTSVMAQVNHLSTIGLHHAAHDINRSIMPIEQ
ncbi:hypothetical protein D3C86_1412280 [compost metagenome]